MAVEIRHQVDAVLGPISSVVTSLPVGYNLGDKRIESGIKYVLVHNAGNSQIGPGFIASPIFSAGPYSLTISTAVGVNDHLGAVVVVHATATTGSFFWGAFQVRVG